MFSLSRKYFPSGLIVQFLPLFLFTTLLPSVFTWAACLQTDMQTFPQQTLISCCRSSPSWSSSTWRRSSLRSSSSPTFGPWSTTLLWPCTGTRMTSSSSLWTPAEGDAPSQANSTPSSYRKRTSAPRVNTWPLPACTLGPQSLRRMKLAASVQSSIDVLEADCHQHAGNGLWCEELMACRQPCIYSPIT